MRCPIVAGRTWTWTGGPATFGFGMRPTAGYFDAAVWTKMVRCSMWVVGVILPTAHRTPAEPQLDDRQPTPWPSSLHWRNLSAQFSPAYCFTRVSHRRRRFAFVHFVRRPAGGPRHTRTHTHMQTHKEINCQYNIRQRHHDRQLTIVSGQLRSRNFIHRILFKDCYWLYHIRRLRSVIQWLLSVSIDSYHCCFNRFLLCRCILSFCHY